MYARLSEFSLQHIFDTQFYINISLPNVNRFFFLSRIFYIHYFDGLTIVQRRWGHRLKENKDMTFLYILFT